MEILIDPEVQVPPWLLAHLNCFGLSTHTCKTSRSALNLLDKMLQVEPKQRIDIAGLLKHPWFGPSLVNAALSVNSELLEMPDALLTGNLLTSNSMQRLALEQFYLKIACVQARQALAKAVGATLPSTRKGFCAAFKLCLIA